MLFSDHFKIDLNGTEDWFDPLLSSDIKLFIDPFLIFEDEFEMFEGSHKEIIEYYEHAFNLVAKAAGDKQSAYWTKAISVLSAPEVEELCLGFTDRGTGGAGTGKGKARLVAEGLEKAVLFGLTRPEHFETVQLFREKIGPDTISDTAANILRMRLAKYTEKVCQELSIPMKTIPHPRAFFDQSRQRWAQRNISAPINPYNGKQILLCPRRYLRPLPTINAHDYWGYCMDSDPDTLRREFGEEITRSVKKEVIIENALNNFDSVKQFIDFVQAAGGEPYDIENDPKGLIKWYHLTKAYVAQNPTKVGPKSIADLEAFIDKLVESFQSFVENNAGWKLLYTDDGKPRSEEICQLAFLGIVKHICHANDIDVSREANIGRGPVDFKFSHGASKRVLLEMKLAKNTKFWNGLRRQLPQYLKSENIDVGKFLIIAFDSDDVGKVQSAEKVARNVSKKVGYKMTTKTVLAEFKPPPASKLS